MPPSAAPDATTASGFLLVLALAFPPAAALVAFVAGGRQVQRIALGTAALGLVLAVAIADAVPRAGGRLVYLLGGWRPPLGVALRADGLAAVMLVMTAVVVTAIAVFARTDFGTPAGTRESRRPFAFWILLLGIWGGLNAVFLSGDVFTLYVALELLTFAAVPLVCLDGRAETLAAALRYLLFALMGSVFYLAGGVLLYGAYGTLDIVLLASRVRADPTTLVAAAMMTVGLLAKTALVPLHLWLPPAHGGAPPAGSALLSALVVKGSFFIVVRLWFDVFPGLPGRYAAELLGALGALAIVLGSVVALRQERLKLLIAYSTLAQIGYLFLMFPLALGPDSSRLLSGGALAGGILQAMSHATAKAAMFMAAGLMYAALGHDRISGLGGIGRARPLSLLAFSLGGVALFGPPASGADLAKTLLLQAAAASGQWWWTLVLQAGGVFTSSYLVLVLANALAPGDRPIRTEVRAPRGPEVAALALAVCSLALGLVSWNTYLPVPAAALSKGSVLETLWKLAWPILGGAALAILLGRWGARPSAIVAGATTNPVLAPAGGIVRALGRLFERIDLGLRQWPAAGLSFLVLTLLFGVAMLAGR